MPIAKSDGTLDASWGTGGGGGGAAYMGPDLNIKTPHAWDDEFNSTTLDPSWSYYASTPYAADTHTTAPSCWWGKYAVGQLTGLQREIPTHTPSAAYSITTHVRNSSTFYTGANNYVCMELHDAAPGGSQSNSLRLLFIKQTIRIDFQAGGGWNYVWRYLDILHHTTDFFMHCQHYTDDTWSLGVGFDGYTYMMLPVYNPPVTFVPRTITIGGFAEAGNNPQMMAIDWVRYNWIFV